ncbi:MAG: HAD family phosphatase [Prevotella sp.]|nr:HAD family phosphatase [Prevotella sp.]MBR1839325.1 HAD family phosphatase [Prevotella sp.]
MLKLDLNKYRCALFDLDGVVFDSEPQYSVFWKKECGHYHPDKPGEEQRIKGMSLTEIFNTFFENEKDEWQAITERLNAWEVAMTYEYVDGFEDFVRYLRQNGVKTAVVTSSNRTKMESVYQQRQDFTKLFDDILTAEDFDRSKPDPDCYLKGMARFGCAAEETVVFEDSVNGLKAGRASGALLIGLSTTNPVEVVKEYTNIVIKNYL